MEVVQDESSISFLLVTKLPLSFLCNIHIPDCQDHEAAGGDCKASAGERLGGQGAAPGERPQGNHGEQVSQSFLLVSTPCARRKMSWCKTPDCDDPTRHCRDMEHTFTQYLQIKRVFSDSKIRVIRYEDFVRDPESQGRELFSWAGINWTYNTQKYIDTHTSR